MNDFFTSSEQFLVVFNGSVILKYLVELFFKCLVAQCG
jgi:hypothetical protein